MHKMAMQDDFLIKIMDSFIAMLDLDRPNNLVSFIYGYDKNVTEISNTDKNLPIRVQLGAIWILQTQKKHSFSYCWSLNHSLEFGREFYMPDTFSTWIFFVVRLEKNVRYLQNHPASERHQTGHFENPTMLSSTRRLRKVN